MSQIAKTFLFCLIFSSGVFADEYRFVKIDFPNSISTFANTISARGDIVGNYDDVNGTHGYLLHEGAFSIIDVPYASSTRARSINARGDVVGFFDDASGVQHGYVLRNGQFTQIDYPGASATVVRGINNAGDITGHYFDAAGNETGVILRDGKFHKVQPPYSFGCGSDVWMAADNGRVFVGDYCDKRDQSIHGYLRDRRGDFQNIVFPGSTFPCTAAHYINERGDITGRYILANSAGECNGPLHGFLLRNGKYITIDFPGSSDTIATAINDDGVIVGIYFDELGVSHGFKAVPNDDERRER